MYIGTSYYCQILIKTEYSPQIFGKYSNINFHENPSSGSRVVPCGRTGRQTDRQTDRQTQRRTDMSQLTVAFRNLANAPKKIKNSD